MQISLEPKQTLAFQTLATELLYGGAAGGMKSFYLRVSLIRWCMEVPGIQVYLFRRTLPDLRDNHLRGPFSLHVMLSEHLQSGHVKYRQQENEFEFWNGSILHLCYCDSENDVEKYRGAEIHVLGIDELTHFTEYQYRFLRSRVRRAGLQVPEVYASRLPRIETASNPGSVGHAWVKRTFISPKAPLEVWKAPPEEGGMLRQFIPAKLSENPYLTRDDPTYADRLRGLGTDDLVRAILEGDWNIIAGQAFEKLRRTLHGTEPFQPPMEWIRFRSLDWGSSKPFSCGFWCVSDGNPLSDGRKFPRGALIRYDEWYGWTGKPDDGLRMEVGEVAEGILKRSRGSFAYTVADPSMWKVDGGPSHAEQMMRHGLVLRKADNSRVAGYLEMRARVAGGVDGPMLYATTNCHAGFWRTMPDLVMDRADVEDVDTDQEDHCFVADTLVCTYNGLQRIGDMVGSEGRVWSDGKFEPYRSCRLTRRNAPVIELLFDNDVRVRCTPDHRFMLESGEWASAKDLVGKTVRLSLTKQPRSFWGSVTGFAGSIFKGAEKDCTAASGPISTAQYLPDSMSITSMATGVITRLKTLICSTGLGICRFTESPMSLSPEVGAISLKFEKRQLSGTQAQRASSGIESTTSRIAQRRCTGGIKRSASNAATFLMARSKRFFALANAGPRTAELPASITSQESASSANLSLLQTDTQRSRHALSHVEPKRVASLASVCLSKKDAGSADVYCLTVPTTGRFSIESGLVVSNCYDDARYACMSRPWMNAEKVKQKQIDRWFPLDEDEEDNWKTA